ncbi:MAG: hypothetical protein RIG84_13275 [Roseovarius sp.]
MPFAPERYAELQRAIRLALASTTLDPQERGFLRDMQAKLARHGPGATLPQRDYRRLMKLTHSRMAQKGGNLSRPAPQRRRGAGRWSGAAINFVVLFLVVCFLGYMAAERFPEYAGPVASLSASKTIEGRVTHVRDGDTIEVAGTPVRFGSLDCAERGTAEGRRATARMHELVRGERLTCHLTGRMSYDRQIGSCRLSEGRDLAAIMIREGYCSRYW